MSTATNTEKLNKAQVRYVLSTKKWFDEELKNTTLEYLERESSRATSDICYDIEKGNYFKVYYSKYLKFDYALNIEMDNENHQLRTSNIVRINDEIYTSEYLESLITDLTKEQQKENLTNLDLTEIEEHASKFLGCSDIKFTSRRVFYCGEDSRNSEYRDPYLTFSTDNLTELTGICSVMLRDIRVEGQVYYIINDTTGEQELNRVRLYLQYTHPDGGRNCYQIGTVQFNSKTGHWEGI